MCSSVRSMSSVALCVSFLLLSVSLCAEEGGLYGWITDATTGNPLGNACISIQHGGRTYLNSTDSNGFYVMLWDEIGNPSSFFELSATKVGYIPDVQTWSH